MDKQRSVLVVLNSFHNTRTVVRATISSVAPYRAWISASVGKRVWRTLCGHPGCTCCGAIGERGGQYVSMPAYDDRGKICAYYLEERA